MRDGRTNRHVGGASSDTISWFSTKETTSDTTADGWHIDDIGLGLAYEDTGVLWTVGQYVPLRIEVDPIGNTIDYYYGGALIYSSVAGVFAGTVIEQVVLVSDNYSAGEVGDFDDLVIDRGDVPVELQSLSIE